MAQVELHPFEAVLRMCAGAAPQPWYPQQYSRRSGMPLEQVNTVLLELWNRGLLEKTPPHPEHGPGLRLSPKGWQTVNEPAAMRGLCASDGFATVADERVGTRPATRLEAAKAETVLNSLRTNRIAWANWTLLGANVAVFLFGLFLAYRDGVPMTYLGGSKTLLAVAIFFVLFVAFNIRAIARQLSGMPRIIILFVVLGAAYRYNLFFFPGNDAAASIRHQCGMLTAADWRAGEWWRLLTACFVHLGLLHLFANMSMLFNGGWFIERLWGSARFLAIYLIAGVTGSMTGLATVDALAGASGALCGLLASEGVWVLFNGKYLPQKIRQDWWNNISKNFMLLVVISMVPGISFMGHAGGALAGAAAAVCMHYQRFGPPVWRWAALLGLIPIPLLGLWLLDRELNDFNRHYSHGINKPLTDEMSTAFKDKVRPLLDIPANQRDDAKVAAALAELAEQRKTLEQWQAELTKSGPYIKAETQAKHADALKAVTARVEIYKQAERCLREGVNEDPKDKKELMKHIAATPELRKRSDPIIEEVEKPQENDPEKQARDQRDREADAERKRQEKIENAEVDKFENELLPKISNPLKTAQNLYDGDLTYDLTRPQAEWVPATVQKNLAATKESRKQLQGVVKLLPTLGPFKAERITNAVKHAGPYAGELEKLLEMAQRRFEAPDKWKDDHQNALKVQENKVDDLRKQWRKDLAQ